MAKFNWNKCKSTRGYKTYQPCKWDGILNRMFETGAESIKIGINETGHSSVQSMRNSCKSALKRLGRGAYAVKPIDDGIMVVRNF